MPRGGIRSRRLLRLIRRIEEGLECGYEFEPADMNRCCRNCKKYQPVDETRGICYEYEVVPYGGCKHFEPK